MFGTSVNDSSASRGRPPKWSPLENGMHRPDKDWKQRRWELNRTGNRLPNLKFGNRRPSTLSLSPLRANSTTRFIFLCLLWYMSSAMSSNTGKSILIQFRYPVTLTFVQFGFLSGYCLLLSSPAFRFTKIRSPTRAIIRNTAPMALFQVGGHMFSSFAMSRVPVSTVHTIKALSPLFTVAAYGLLFRVRYSPKTYISLLPLTLGVMLACSFDVSTSNLLGLFSAFGSAIIFVSSNIFFKKIMPPPSASAGLSSPAHKLDKLNLLFYSSGMAFLLMIPIWVYSDLSALLSPRVRHPPHPTPHSILYYFFWNGTVHFGQNIIAFAILATTSPITYSIASLIKRVAVILIAIAWFNQTVHPIQACGIGLTFFGLWMYHNAKDDVEKGEKKMLKVEAERQLMLPTTEQERKIMNMTVMPRVSDGLKSTGRSHGTATTSVSHNHTIVSPTASSHGPLSMVPPPPPLLRIHTSSRKSSMYNHRTSAVISPTDSYPSPPPSLDSPPDDTTGFQAGLRPHKVT